MSALSVPSSTKKNAPPVNSAAVSASGPLVNTKAAPAEPVAVTVYIPFWTALAWFLIKTLSATETVTPSIVKAPLALAVKVPAPLL